MLRNFTLLVLLALLSGCSFFYPTEFAGLAHSPVSSATLKVDGDVAILDVQYTGSSVLPPIYETLDVTYISQHELHLKRKDGVELVFVHSHGISHCAYCIAFYRFNTFPVAWVVTSGWAP